MISKFPATIAEEYSMENQQSISEVPEEKITDKIIRDTPVPPGRKR